MKIRSLLVVIAPLALACGPHSGGKTSSGPKRVFVHWADHNANFGGLSGADSYCQSTAQAQSLGGTWKAWLSDSHTNAIVRITDVGPWYFVDQTTLAFRNRADLGGVPLVGLTMDANGDTIVTPKPIWTGTNSGGLAAPGAVCGDWTSTTGQGMTGMTAASDATWTQSGPKDCSTTTDMSVICLEQ